MKTVAVNLGFMLISLLATLTSRSYNMLGWQLWILPTMCLAIIVFLDLKILYQKRKTQRGIKNGSS